MTATHLAPILVPDRAHLERGNILPPNAGGPQGDTYKLLRTQVLQRLDQLGANTLAVLSPAADHGNTLTAINLAIATAAEFGRTALLVDLNLRDPAVHRRLGIEPKAGIESCLRGAMAAEQVIVRIAGYERFAVMPCREPVENSSELLSSQRAMSLTEELRRRYVNRIIIFDLPPILPTDDALAFSRTVQAGLIVVSDERTQREHLRRSLALLGEMPIIGTVLNGARDTAGKRS
ncbi:MAG TPA: hypothetical protein VMI92_11230 [Steroidobacteraceae bacterium]|nr:hypothetical protein [Steroidobacteraceae bacterium]